MCGIVGYIGSQRADQILLTGLQRLEYRGYDSAGIAIVDNFEVSCVKREGKVSVLADQFLSNGGVPGSLGIGHTRWATHGAPCDRNSHPHMSSDGRFALVHNGIIENYATLKAKLKTKGYHFQSDTDTEVLVRLLEDVQKMTQLSLEDALPQALSQVEGTYGVALVTAEDPDLMIGARMGSPLIIGVGNDEFFLGSDAAPIIEHTRQVVYLNDGEMVVLRRSGFEVRTIENIPLEKEIHELEWDLEQIEKGGFEHFMLKEIMEQPEAIENAIRGRIRLDEHRVVLGGLIDVMDQLRAADRVIIAACGTSWHAALVGEYLIEALARVPVEVEYASEFRYRKPILRDNDVVMVISQSGETADTLAAVREAKRQGVLCLGICNTVGSTIARETDAGVYLHAGPEIGVASTKAFTAQVSVLTLIALRMAEGRTISNAETASYLEEVLMIPDQIRNVLEHEEEVQAMA